MEKPTTLELAQVPLALLKEHPLNPRKRFDAVKLEELAASVREAGIMNPLLVRTQGAGYQILAGARRFRAAQLASLEEVPVIVREMDDVAALELLVIDNDQREDVHPLEEAMGYQQLMERGKWDVARLAARVGRSVKYVYDRVKLLSLTKEAQRLFLEDRFTPGHAILLARLKPEDQKRAIGNLDVGRYGDEIGAGGGLFTDARGLDFGDKDSEPWDEVKPVSVRELEHWIDQHVRLEAHAADPMIFPDLVDTVAAAEDKREKVVRITHNDITPDELRDGPKAILGRSWKRADGKHGSKTCEHSVIGNVVIGPDRGEAFRVCVAKEKCAVHWGDRIKTKKKREAAVTKEAAKTGEDRQAIADRKRKEEETRAKALQARMAKATPAIIAALVAAVKKAPPRPDGVLGRIVLDFLDDNVLGEGREAAKHLGPGKSADDLVRHLAFTVLFTDMIGDLDLDYLATKPEMKALGLNFKKILDEAAPEPKPEKKRAAADGKKEWLVEPGLKGTWYVSCRRAGGNGANKIETHHSEAAAKKRVAELNAAEKKPAPAKRAKGKAGSRAASATA